MMTRTFTAKRLFFVWIALAFVLAWSDAHAGQGAGQTTVRIAVASNFLTPAKALAKRFEALSGTEVQISTGSTGKLYAQIANGAPFDVFLAANAREPQRLEAEGLAVPGTRFTYARGRLALWCLDADTPQNARACLLDPTKRIAIANPKLAPYGQAAIATLGATLGAEQGASAGRVVSGENIAQAFQMVWSGNAPVGFVALSQIKTRTDVQGAYWTVPEDLHAPIDQQAVLLSRAVDAAPAKAFLDFVQSSESRTLVELFGYAVTTETAEVR